MEDLQLYLPKKTGELMFQFDSDDPIPIIDIMDRGEVIFKLKQTEITVNDEPTTHNNLVISPSEHYPNTILFRGNGKEFKIFIKPIS